MLLIGLCWMAAVVHKLLCLAAGSYGTNLAKGKNVADKWALL